MSSPLVSICLPNLNTYSYLQERIDTIVKQTYTNWELIVIDGFSDDGSWEFFKKLARNDSRVSIAQAPRGLYESWNKCIEQACGEYVYIATSDDTMAYDCLQKLVAALEKHNDCDLAHCRLIAIDKDGAPLANQGLGDAVYFAGGISELVGRRHLCRAPYDGLLHLTGKMVHLSITELLIRRSLFSRIGGFEVPWGSIGDRNCEIKAGLVANTIHVPDTWASWRIHAANASASMNFHSFEYTQAIEEMLHDFAL
jgi:glycosyltransferase involved in cell wall biosynthesis